MGPETLVQNPSCIFIATFFLCCKVFHGPHASQLAFLAPIISTGPSSLSYCSRWVILSFILISPTANIPNSPKCARASAVCRQQTVRGKLSRREGEGSQGVLTFFGEQHEDCASHAFCASNAHTSLSCLQTKQAGRDSFSHFLLLFLYQQTAPESHYYLGPL